MSCAFINTLTEEQRGELLKLLQEEAQPTPQYRVEVEFWDKERTQIKSLREYMGEQRYGKDIGWYDNGQKRYDNNYVNGKLHGKCAGWYPNGQLHWEENYVNGQRHGKRRKWHDNGQIRWEEDCVDGQLHGKYIAWDESGRVTREEDWEHDVRKHVQML